MLEDVSTEKKGGNIARRQLSPKVDNDWQCVGRFKNLSGRGAVASAREHDCDCAFMLTTIGIAMDDLVKLGRSSESDNDKQIRCKQTNERLLPASDVAKSRHARYLSRSCGCCKIDSLAMIFRRRLPLDCYS